MILVTRAADNAGWHIASYLPGVDDAVRSATCENDPLQQRISSGQVA